MFHWDIDTTMRPLPRMVQGVLYLTDTTAEQGGFQCAPGFHRQFHEWVKTQPGGPQPPPSRSGRAGDKDDPRNRRGIF